MKSRMVTSMMAAIILTLFFVDIAYALTTRAEIYLTVRVVSALSLDLENKSLHQNLKMDEAEPFSELKKRGILVDKLRRGSTTVWLFTKTE